MNERDAAVVDAVVTVARALAGHSDLDAILDLIARRGRALVAARALTVELREGGRTVLAAAAGDLHGGAAGAGGSPECPPLVVPVALRGRPFGALIAIDRQGGGPGFTVEDEEVLEMLAASAATAVATTRTFDPARRRDQLVAGEAERARWARQLHDGTLRKLEGLRLSLVALGGAGPGSAGRLVQQAIAEVEAAAERVGALIVELRPVVLDRLGVAAAIEALADRLEVPELEIRTGIDLSFEEGRAAGRLDEELETTIYRIVQEALANVVKHAAATRALVELTEDDALDEVRLEVQDDGDGFDLAGRGEGVGLTLMRERVELLGGSIEVRSAAGRGTQIAVTLPSGRRRSMLRID